MPKTASNIRSLNVTWAEMAVRRGPDRDAFFSVQDLRSTSRDWKFLEMPFRLQKNFFSNRAEKWIFLL